MGGRQRSKRFDAPFMGSSKSYGSSRRLRTLGLLMDTYLTTIHRRGISRLFSVSVLSAWLPWWHQSFTLLLNWILHFCGQKLLVPSLPRALISITASRPYWMLYGSRTMLAKSPGRHWPTRIRSFVCLRTIT